jgi:glutamine synthetase
LRNGSGRNVFAVSDSELSGGRADAAYEDTKFMSKEGEHFLAGVIDGIADGTPKFLCLTVDSFSRYQLCPWYVFLILDISELD